VTVRGPDHLAHLDPLATDLLADRISQPRGCGLLGAGEQPGRRSLYPPPPCSGTSQVFAIVGTLRRDVPFTLSRRVVSIGIVGTLAGKCRGKASGRGCATGVKRARE
jgi:hypothetical protein